MNHYLHRLFQKNITDLYIMHTVRNFAFSLVSIFIPIYFLQQGFSIFEVGWYIASFYLLLIPSSYIGMKLAAKTGIKKAFWVSLPISLLFIISLNYLLQIQIILGTLFTILIIATLQALNSSIYWMSYHIEFTKFSSKKKGAKQLGLTQVFSVMAGIAAPLIGAVTIAQFSYPLVFATVATLLIIAFIPMIFSKDDHEPFEFKIQKLTTKRLKDYVLPYFAEGLYNPATSFFWPIMLFFLFTSLPKMGGLYMASNFLHAAVMYFVSFHLTEKNRFKLLLFGTIMHGASLVARIFVKTIGAAFAIQSFGGFSGPFFVIPFHNLYYNKAKKEKKAEHIYFREVYLNLGRFSTAALLIIMLFLFEPIIALSIMLVFSAIALQGLNLIKK